MAISCGPGGSTGQEIADQINNNTTDINNNAGDIADNTTAITDINNVLPTKMDDGDAFLKTEHTPTGPGTPGQPITLNPDGLVDGTLVEISAFDLIGEYTPAAGAECPVPFANANHGDFWIIEAPQGDEETWEYTFTGDCSAELDGWITRHGDIMLRGKDIWVLRRRVLDASQFVLKTGDRMQGDLEFDNNMGVKGYTSSGALKTLITLNSSNRTSIGDSDLYSIYLAAGHLFEANVTCTKYFEISNYDGTLDKMQVYFRDQVLRFQARDENNLGEDLTVRAAYFSQDKDPTSNTHLVPLGYANSHYESVLGNPSTNGYILSSDTSGNRSWIAPPSGGGDTVYWGDIEGTLSNQTDLQSALNGKSPTNHSHSGTYHPLHGNTSTALQVPTIPSGHNDAVSKMYVDSKLGGGWALKTGDRSGNEHFGYTLRHAWGYGAFKVLMELRDNTQGGGGGSAPLVYWGVKYRFFEYTVNDPINPDFPDGYNPGEFVGGNSQENRSVNIGHIGGMQQDDDLIDFYVNLSYDDRPDNPDIGFMTLGHISRDVHVASKTGGTPDTVMSNYKILAVFQKE